MLNGRRIVITGGSSGIGRGLSLEYSGHGARVLAVGRNADELDDLSAGYDEIQTVVADLTESAGRRAVTTAAEHAWDGVDVVVHAAGLLGPPDTRLVDYPENEWRRVFEINVTAVQLLHQELAAHLDRGDSPAVIAVSSTVGREGRAGWGMYAISKHALEGWVAVLAQEWTRGRVYSVNPGGTRTPMRAAAVPDEDPATLPTVSDIAPLFLRLAHPEAPEPSGAVLNARDWMGLDPWQGLEQPDGATA